MIAAMAADPTPYEEWRRMTCLKGTRARDRAAPARSARRSCAGCWPASSGRPARVTVFSRDEAKQHDMRLSYLHRATATDEVDLPQLAGAAARSAIGDVRDYRAVARAVRGRRRRVHAAALKQVPTCEYFPFEAVQTNVVGAAEPGARDPRDRDCRSRRSSASRPTRRASRSTSWA